MSFPHRFFNVLSANYKTLLDQAQDNGDVTIIVKGNDDNTNNNDDNNIFKAHSLILSAQCPWFKTTLSTKQKDTENIVINVTNISPFIFDIILKYLYYGEITLNSLSGKDTFDLLMAMDELKIIEMLECLQDILLFSNSEWLRENFFFTYKFSLKCQELKKLHQYFDKIIQDQPDILFVAKDFTKIDKDLLISLIKREDLVMSEIDVWRKLIVWGKEHIQISKPLTDWNKEDFKALKLALDQCIPLIRFTSITSIDYYYEVRPYEKVIPDEVKETVIQYHMISRVLTSESSLSPRIGIINSTVITSREAALIATWMNKSIKPYRFSEIPYEFKLLLRGSQDGFNSEIFHSKCLNKSNTLVIIRIAGTRKIIGGYNPLEWKKCVEWKPVVQGFGTSQNSTSQSSGLTLPTNARTTSSLTQTSGSSFNFGRFAQASSKPTLTTQATGFGFSSQASSKSPFATQPIQPTGFGFSSTQVSSKSPFATQPTQPTGFGFPNTQASSKSPFTTQATGFGVPSSQASTFTTQPTGFGFPSSQASSKSSFATQTTQPTGFGLQASSKSPFAATQTTQPTGFGVPSLQASSKSPFTTQATEFGVPSSQSTQTTSSASKVISLPNVADVVQGLCEISVDTTEKRNFEKCKESFIFSFDYGEDNEAKIVKSNVKDFNYGIGFLTKLAGPIFGNGDLIMSGNNFKTDKMCSCNQTSYEKPIIESTEKFSIDEYEIFQINDIKKPFTQIPEYK